MLYLQSAARISDMRNRTRSLKVASKLIIPKSLVNYETSGKDRKDRHKMATATITETIPLRTDKDGVIRVSKTRVTFDTIVAAYLEGATAEESAVQYPVVPLADVYSVIGYYLHQKKKVHAYLKRREKFADEVRKENEARFNNSSIRERLLARQTHS